MIPSQMLKGILDGCILAIINNEELYGYEISQKLNNYGFEKISEGTIYPLLLRLEKNNYIKSIIKESKIGPKRKYYYLSELGKQELQAFKTNFNELATAVNNILKRSDNYE